MSKCLRNSPEPQTPMLGRRTPATHGVMPRGSARRAGFTLLEVLVVMGIAALVAAITLGGFAQLGASQKRTTCQTNMIQLYQACRLYQADEGGFPYFDPTIDTSTLANIRDRNIGLWALYAFPNPANSNGIQSATVSMPSRYLKSINTLHCPQDSESGHDVRIDPLVPTLYNADFLSYQTTDIGDGGSIPDYYTYQSKRIGVKVSGNDWERQLIPNIAGVAVPTLPAESTVVTWCPWHRAAAGSRQYDNVLFYDGSVQLISRSDDNDKTGWHRTPRSRNVGN